MHMALMITDWLRNGSEPGPCCSQTITEPMKKLFKSQGLRFLSCKQGVNTVTAVFMSKRCVRQCRTGVLSWKADGQVEAAVVCVSTIVIAIEQRLES